MVPVGRPTVRGWGERRTKVSVLPASGRSVGRQCAVGASRAKTGEEKETPLAGRRASDSAGGANMKVTLDAVEVNGGGHVLIRPQKRR